MGNKNTLTKVLAIAGTALVWFPIFATFATSSFGTIRSGMFRFDYLLPAELGLVSLIGGGLLIWAAIRAKAMRKPIIWTLVGSYGLLFVGTGIAQITGIASGASEPVPWKIGLVLAPIIIYALGIILEGIFGIQLIRVLFQTKTVTE